VRFPWQKWAEKRRLAQSYRAIFAREDELGEDGRIVLADLAVMCRATSSVADDEEGAAPVDPCRLAFEEGKRKVWLHISSMLALENREIVNALRAHRAEIAAEIMNVQQQAVSER
jgi:hypothetical protein